MYNVDNKNLNSSSRKIRPIKVKSFPEISAITKQKFDRSEYDNWEVCMVKGPYTYYVITLGGGRLDSQIW